MSRRKQERPQPRKNLVKGEAAELDILTCGACQRDFPLCEIVRFIQHKVNTCNKENSCLTKLFPVPPDDSDSEDILYSIPHNKSMQGPPYGCSPSMLKNTVAKDIQAEYKDTSEPCCYICSTCKQSYMSAWTLLQHVQNQHNLKIYIVSDHRTSPYPVASEHIDVKPNITPSPSFHSALRAPLLERQLDATGPLFPRTSSQEFRIDLLGLSSASNPKPEAQTTPPPPLIEMHNTDTTSQTSSLGIVCDQPLDIYSQRLKELAGAASPNGSSSSPAKLPPTTSNKTENEKSNSSPKNNNGCSQTPQNASITPPQVPPSSSSSTASDNQPASPKGNTKMCEFCGKSFRFMSNLIVHRRSHTGEKPFKCHICNHACTQASKLKRHMKTHKRKKYVSVRPLLDGSFESNGIHSGEETVNMNFHDGQTNGETEYCSDDHPHDDETEDEEDEDIDVEDGDIDEQDKKKLREVMVAEDLSRKPIKNNTCENNGIGKIEKKDNSTYRHSLLSEVMEKIGLASIQQYSEAYKQALKESALLKQERHSDGCSSNDCANNIQRPSREGTRSAGQSPLSFNNTGILSAFDHSMSVKRVKLEDQWRDKDDNKHYAGVWMPSISSVSSLSLSSYKDLFGADGSDRRKSKTESALNSMSPNNGRSSSPRPGTSNSLCSLGTIANNITKPKEQRRNDTCEYCGKVFKNCSNLTVHRRSHTGEKPYKCELCSYACAQSSKLTRHMKTHGRLDKDVYRCRFCDMPFSVPSTLEKHMRKCVVSQGGEPYLLPDHQEMAS